MAKITSFSDAHPPVCLPFRPAGVVVPERVPRIEYLAIRALGEVPRLLLEVTNTPYDSILHFGDKTLWKSRAEFTQLPIYSDASLGDFYLAQSGAIVRHIARTTGTDGDTPMRKALADMAYEASKDIYDAKGGIYPESTDAQKTKLKGYLEGVERMLSRGGPYTGGAGAPLTFGDVGLFHALRTIEECVPGYLASNGYKHLSEFTTAFAALPNIAAYLASGRRLPITLNETGKAPWHPQGYAWLTPLADAVLAQHWEAYPA